MAKPQNAWAMRLFLALSSPLAVFPFSACESEDAEALRARRPGLRGLIDTPEYFERCEKELGQMPAEIDCRSGTPITFSGLGENAHGLDTCDNPSYGVPDEDGCSGTSFLVTQKSSTGSDVVTICRFGGKGETLSVAATIAHNPETGATCFYQFKKDTDSSQSGKLPGPTASLSTRAIHRNWEPPEYITQVPLGTCVECHSAYPWVRNPYVLESEGLSETMPRNGNKKAPYWVVARKDLEEHYAYDKSRDRWFRATDLWTPVVLDEARLKAELPRESTTCLNCHRMGRGRMMKGWSALAVGYHSFGDAEGRPASEKLFDLYAQRLSSEARAWPERNWHDGLFQTPLKSAATEEEWRSQLKKPMDLLFECGTLPKNCVWKALPEPGPQDEQVEPKLSAFPCRGQGLSELLGRLSIGQP